MPRRINRRQIEKQKRKAKKLAREKRKAKREHMSNGEIAMRRLKIFLIALVVIFVLYVIIFPDRINWG